MSIFVAQTANDVATQARYAAFGQMFGQALSTFGWVAQTGHGEIAATGSGSSRVWTGTPNINASIVQPCASYVFKGAFVGGTTYTGIGTTINSSSVNVVTSGGLTYIHITASSNSATAPASDTTNWAPWNFEIWKSADGYSSSFPIYLKIGYVQNTTTNVPSLLLQVGQGVDADGNITGAVILWSTAPTTFMRANETTPIDGARYNHYFSGDSGNFRFCIFKDKSACNNQSGGQAVYQACQIFVIDRACTSITTQSNRDDAFVYICHAVSQGGSVVPASVIMPNPSTSTYSVSYDASRWAMMNVFSTFSGGGGGITPLLIFPAFGVQQNPQMGACGFMKTQVQDGCVIPIWMYGNPHLYLVCGNVADNGPTGVNSTTYHAILWE